MYAVRMTPIDRPTDSMEIPGFDTPRDAWNELLTQLERDQDGIKAEAMTVGNHDEWDLFHAYQAAIDDVLGSDLDSPGVVQVGSEFKYGAIAS